MQDISFMGANLVAQQLNWSMTEGWMQGDGAANAYYEPIATFPERFGQFVDLAVGLGFTVIDVWTGQLNWEWATPAHLTAAREALDKRGVKVVSYAGSFGGTVADFEAASRVAKGLGAKILGGNTPLLAIDRAAVLKVLREQDVILALENHPEKSSAELLVKIGNDSDGRIGAAIDTGWWGTQGYSAPQSILDLAGHIKHIHLKDIRAVGAHETCSFGEGVVGIEASVLALKHIGYSGPISIEHEPEHFDPSDDVKLSRSRLIKWLEA